MNSGFLVLITIIFIGCASSPSRIRILQSPGQAFSNSYDTLEIKKIRMDRWSDSIVVKLKNNRKIVLGENDIWGYQESDSSIWRYESGRLVLVRQLDTPSIYSVSHSSGKSWHSHYYFSKNPSSGLCSFSWKTIKKEFADNPCFLSKLKKLNFFQPYETYDRKKRSYRFVSLYKECRNDISSIEQ